MNKVGNLCVMGNGVRSDPHSSRNELHVVSANVSVQVFNNVDVSITMNVPKKRGFWSALMQVLQHHEVEITNASLYTNQHSDFHSINCKV